MRPNALTSMLVGVALIFPGVAAHAQAQYVRICGNDGGWFYVPNSDICVNVLTGESRQATAGGTWLSHAEPTAGEWVSNPEVGCTGGRLIDVATLTGDDLSHNAYGRYESSTPFELDLAAGEFIANVMMTGGLTVSYGFASWPYDQDNNPICDQGPTLDPGGTLLRSRFCVAMRDSSSASQVLGCKDTTPLADQSATFSFTPSWSEPPSSFASPIFLIGQEDGEEDWGSPPPATCGQWRRVTQSITGSLAITACVRHVDDSATPTTCDSAAATCDESASTPAVCVAGGSLFTVAVNGPAGTRYAVCSVAPAGFEGAVGDEFRCVGADGTDTEPDLLTAEQVAAQFGDGFCGSPVVGP